jgi:hypothetical protein
MSVFKKQGVYWIDNYVNGHRKRERIASDERLAETVLRQRASREEGGMIWVLPLPIKPKSPFCAFAIPCRMLTGSANSAQNQASPGVSLHVGSLPIATLSADATPLLPLMKRKPGPILK